MPKRIQRKRAKGWRMPPNAKSVTRPGPFGNPFTGDGAAERFRRWLGSDDPESRPNAGTPASVAGKGPGVLVQSGRRQGVPWGRVIGVGEPLTLLLFPKRHRPIKHPRRIAGGV